MLEKRLAYNNPVHQLFIDFKKDRDSVMKVKHKVVSVPN
jgi:hypothetical protein